MNDGLSAFFAEHIERFNAGVRGGDFRPMVEHFDADAVMVFEGVPVGPFQGRDAILAAYADNPPDDQVEILDVAELDESTLVGVYEWRGGGGKAGEMQLTMAGDLITHLVVSFDSD